MKKLILVSLLSLGFGVSQAATTATLFLKGTVPQLLSIAVTADAIATNLPLDTTQNDTLVGKVVESSNSSTGYKVSIASANLGKLVHGTQTSSVINYSLKYDGQAVNLSTGQEFSYGSSNIGSFNRDVKISYTGAALFAGLYQGDYTDTVTFTISAN